MIGRLVLVALAIVSIASALAFGLAFVALPWSSREWLGLARLLAAMSAVTVTVAALAALTHRRLWARRDPSPAAIVALFELPLRTALTIVAQLFLVACLDALGGGVISGLRLGDQLAAVSLAFAFHQNGALHLALLWRSLLYERHLGRLPLARVELPTRRRLALRYSLRVASAVVLMAGCVLAVPLAYDASASALPVATVLALGFVGGTFGALFGRRIARDVRGLERYVRALVAAPEGDVELPTSRLRSSIALDVATRVRELARRHVGRAEAQSRARRTVEETQRLKTRFLAYMSHDLRAPLHSITGFADLLAEEVDGPLNHEQHASVRAILESGEVLSQLVTEIVDTARLEAGRLAIHRQPTLLLDVLDEAVERAQRTAPAGGIEIAVELPRWPALELDRDRMVQAFVGVLAHVVRMTPSGLIEIAGGREPSALVVTIDALGLPPEDTQRIFLAFRDLKRPSGGRAGGLGIGLSLARQLVEAHGGRLHYASQGPRGGARFTFELPLDATSSATC